MTGISLSRPLRPSAAGRGTGNSVLKTTDFVLASLLKNPPEHDILNPCAEGSRSALRGAERRRNVTEKKGIKVAAQNRKARHDYDIEDRYEAGIELYGTEVKSIRAGTLNLRDAYCAVRGNELFVHGMHISPYEKGNIFNRDPIRERRLLMHRREIRKLAAYVQQDGYTLIPLSVYFKNARVKVEVGLCKGRKNYDKRSATAKRDAQREIDRHMKERNR